MLALLEGSTKVTESLKFNCENRIVIQYAITGSARGWIAGYELTGSGFFPGNINGVVAVKVTRPNSEGSAYIGVDAGYDVTAKDSGYRKVKKDLYAVDYGRHSSKKRGVK